MDEQRFDRLTKHLGSRRAALTGILAGFALPSLEAAARGKDNKRKRKGKDKQRKKANARAEPCWRAGACIPGKGNNVSRCDLSGDTTFPSLDSTNSNLSRANLRGVNARGVNFTKANLSGACLVNVDFTGATFARNTNLAKAIFCNTIMPDGSPNNSGCGRGTDCCPICTSPAQCEAGQFCCNGTCANCPCGQVHLVNGACVTPCSAGCGVSPCGCYFIPGYCGNVDTDTGNLCPRGDIDCPLGQFCNTFTGECALICAG